MNKNDISFLVHVKDKEKGGNGILYIIIITGER